MRIPAVTQSNWLSSGRSNPSVAPIIRSRVSREFRRFAHRTARGEFQFDAAKGRETRAGEVR